MALVKCKECGAQVSSEAKACPQCGAAPPKRTSTLTWLVLGFIVLVVIGSMTKPDRSSSGSSSTSSAAVPDDSETKEFLWMERGKDMVKAKLKDPDSAKFREVYFYRSVAGKVPVTCGQVNSKNSMGGYGGFQHFVSAGKPELTWLSEEVKDFETIWNKLCTGERAPAT